MSCYNTEFDDLPSKYPSLRDGLEWNYAYYPILLPDEESRILVEQALSAQNIIPRRYFYPALSNQPYLKEEWRTSCPVAEGAAKRMLCLPMYGELPPDHIERISMTIRKICISKK